MNIWRLGEEYQEHLCKYRSLGEETHHHLSLFGALRLTLARRLNLGRTIALRGSREMQRIVTCCALRDISDSVELDVRKVPSQARL